MTMPGQANFDLPGILANEVRSTRTCLGDSFTWISFAMDLPVRRGVQDNAEVWLCNDMTLHPCESSIELIRDSPRIPRQKDHLGNKRA